MVFDDRIDPLSSVLGIQTRTSLKMPVPSGWASLLLANGLKHRPAAPKYSTTF